MNKEEITHSQTDEEKETFTEEDATRSLSNKEAKVLTEREIKSMVIEGLKSVAKDLTTQFQVFVIGASASFVISFIASKIIKKISK